MFCFKLEAHRFTKKIIRTNDGEKVQFEWKWRAFYKPFTSFCKSKT
jgi:hypothetical protein